MRLKPNPKSGKQYVVTLYCVLIHISLNNFTLTSLINVCKHGERHRLVNWSELFMSVTVFFFKDSIQQSFQWMCLLIAECRELRVKIQFTEAHQMYQNSVSLQIQTRPKSKSEIHFFFVFYLWNISGMSGFKWLKFTTKNNYLQFSFKSKNCFYNKTLKICLVNRILISFSFFLPQ